MKTLILISLLSISSVAFSQNSPGNGGGGGKGGNGDGSTTLDVTAKDYVYSGCGRGLYSEKVIKDNCTKVKKKGKEEALTDDQQSFVDKCCEEKSKK